MREENYLFTSESVTEGHPDKIADQISDAVLDAILTQDPAGRVACETAVTTGMVLLFGEVTTSAHIDYKKVVRDTLTEIGYDDPRFGFPADSVAILVSLDEQSPDIAQGVNQEKELDKKLGAGDQGLMFGYATNETPELMPLAISLSHKLAQKLAQVRKSGLLDYLGPDGKTQVSVEYDSKGRALRVDNVVVSSQHDPSVSLDKIRQDIKREVIEPIVPDELLDDNTHYYINPTGRFVTGGPKGDSGLTGRKIIVDTYGGMARHGGGAFSGKDATKVDRSATYAARYVAKNIVAAGLADRCEVQLAYAIGVSHPTSVMVETFQTSSYTNSQLTQAIREVFDLSPAGIIKSLELNQPIYKQTAAYGHFGRPELDLPWERTDKVEDLKKAIEK